MYLNAQSILSKVNDLEATAYDINPDLILVTESWCHKNISESVLRICNYELISDLRCDRQDTANGIGGGLLVYARKGLVVLSIDKKSDFNQFVSFKVLSDDCELNIILIYRPPSCSKDNNDKLCKIVEEAAKNTILVGDFNFPSIDWDNLTCDSRGEPFLNACLDNNFSQFVGFSTHSKNNILDLVLANNNCILSVDNLGPLGNSDHVMMLIKTDFLFKTSEGPKSRLNWKKANFDNIRKELNSIKWVEALKSESIDSKWETFKNIVNEVIYTNIPESVCVTNGKPAWVNQFITRLRRKKQRLYKKMKRTEREEDINEYRKSCKELKKATRKAKRKIEVKISKEVGNDGKKKFNQYVKSKMGKSSTIGPLLDESGKPTANKKDMADILNNYFASVFTRETEEATINVGPLPTESTLSRIKITRKDVLNALAETKKGKAPGPDMITNTFMKETDKEIAEPLTILFQCSLDKGEIPEEWKMAKVVPLFKKGGKGVAGNYRPVSLTSSVCKVLERIIRCQIVKHLELNNLILSSQHGFQTNRSCQTNLIEFLDEITKRIDEGESVDICYLDFSKAFDKIPHSKLIRVLEAHGIKGSVLNWIKEWLRDRQQWVEIEGAKSDKKQVYSGIIQGSVLGPILFIIYINCMDNRAEQFDIIRKFADDTKCAKAIKSESDKEEFQEGLNSLAKWSKEWGMEFNKEKCKIMHCGRKNEKYSYMIENVELKLVEYERDVGVTVASSMKPSQQCSEVINKARVVLGQISRCFHYRDKKVFLRLYKQYVRPHLEFASPVWSPWCKTDIEAIEQIQKKAIGMISGLNSRDYLERLKEIGLWTLEKRREMFDLIQVHKIIHGVGNVKTSIEIFGEIQTTTTRTRSCALNLKKLNARLDIRKNFFTHRVVDKWNQVPENIKTISSPAKFKNKLVEWMK